MHRLKSLGLVLLLVGIMIFTIGCEDSSPEKVDSANPPEQSEDQDNEQDETSSDENFKVGDTVKMGDFEITLTAVNEVEADEMFGPEDGEKWIAFDVTLKNLADSAEPISSILMFSAIDEDGYKADQAIFANTKGSLDGELGAGREMKGEIAYSFPEDHKTVEFIFEPNVLGTGQAIFEVTLP